MRHPSSSFSHRWTCILLLAAFCAILAIAPAAAQTAPAVSPSAVPTATVAAPVSAETATFLASLSAVPTTPTPSFLQTATPGCTSDTQCLPDKLCCRDCGAFNCTHKGCLTPINGQCPLVP